MELMTSDVAQWNRKTIRNVDNCVYRTYLVLPERQHDKTMEYTLLEEVSDLFVFGSRTGLSHQRFGVVVGYLKVAAEVGGEPASVHGELQKKRGSLTSNQTGYHPGTNQEG